MLHGIHRLLFVSLLLSAPAAIADAVQFPLAISSEFMQTLLREQVFTGPDDSLRLNDDGSGCQFLELKNPRVSTRPGAVIVRTSAAARSGRLLAGRCMLLLNWQGDLELMQTPVVAADGRHILLQTTSWQALRADGQPDNVITTIGGWLEQYLPADLKQTPIDLSEPLRQLQEVLLSVTAAEYADRGSTLIDSVRVDGVRANEQGAIVTLALDVPPAPPPAPHREPRLDAAELAALGGKLDDVDAFVTNLIKTVTGDAGTANADALLEVLVELRMELLAILSEPVRREEDPAQTLFVNAWDGLVPILRNISSTQTDQASALRYLSFISAGDALRTLDSVGPAAGIEISSDGLRRLARILIPDTATDVLERPDAVDPELRESLGFGAPIPPPQFYSESSILDWFIPRAYAASLDSATITRLNNWVPQTKDMDIYLPMVRDVLNQVVSEQLRSNDLDGQFREVFRHLVFATAWQESCWRQFVARDAKRVPMQSGTGDVGMMQINPKVWRGLYDLQGLRWDIVYNARAGADILEHHMIHYAIGNREHRVTGDADNLARASYAAYNGGPRQYDRYRRGDAPAYAKKVDALFLEKYRELKRGRELAVMACYRG